MTTYLISFPSDAMVVTEEELPVVAAAAHTVIEEAKEAGVYVFAAGVDESVDPVLVGADGSVRTTTYPGSRSRAASPSSTCRTARPPRGGRRRSPRPAGAPKSCGWCSSARGTGQPKTFEPVVES